MRNALALWDAYLDGWNNSDRAPASFAPAVDVDETSKGYHFEFDLPGLDKKDIRVDYHNGELVVSGERSFENERKEKSSHRSERFFGRFERRFRVPDNVDSAKIDATYEAGVLKIDLLKKEGAKVRQIDIK